MTNDGMIGLENSNLMLDNVVLDNTDRRRIRSVDSPLVVKNSIFTSIFEPGETPTTDNLSEHIWGGGVPSDGQWILENILANNHSMEVDGAFPDLIELFNPSSQPFDLSGYSISDDANRPNRFLFPANTVVGAGEYLTLIAATDENNEDPIGFALNNMGFETLATENVFGTGVIEGPITIPANLLKPGENVFAAEIHQSTFNFDIAFGLSLAGSVPVVEDNSLEILDDGLRITEIVYNSGDSSLDFIELANLGDQSFDVRRSMVSRNGWLGTFIGNR